MGLIGLENASDREIWDYANENGLVIVSKDSDFNQLSFLLGAPPKVVWLRVGNCTTDLVAEILRRNVTSVKALNEDNETAILMLEP